VVTIVGDPAPGKRLLFCSTEGSAFQPLIDLHRFFPTLALARSVMEKRLRKHQAHTK